MYGRFPRGYLEGESSLYSFLQSQRGRYRAGKLQEGRKRYLDKNLPGWLTPPKAEREHALWQQRVTELDEFIRAHGRYPRYKTAASPSEKILAVWLERQRDCLRTAKLTRSRQNQLTLTALWWQTFGRPH